MGDVVGDHVVSNLVGPMVGTSVFFVGACEGDKVVGRGVGVGGVSVGDQDGVVVGFRV